MQLTSESEGKKSDGSSGKVHAANLQTTEILPLKRRFYFSQSAASVKNPGNDTNLLMQSSCPKELMHAQKILNVLRFCAATQCKRCMKRGRQPF